MKPRFSIITCTKNSKQFLPDNIKSLSAQTCRDFEHIFIDGKSSDSTKKIILEYQKLYPKNVKFFQFEPRGIADAMNNGIRLAEGQYIMHLHSDDFLHDPNVLEDARLFLDKHSPDWIYSKELEVDSSGKPIKILFDKKIFQLGGGNFFGRYFLKYIDFVRHQSVFIKKEVFDRFGTFDETFKGAMDYEYWLRIRNHSKWIFFQRIVSCFRRHEGGLSSSTASKTLMRTEEMRAARMYMNFFEFYVLRFLLRILGHFSHTIVVYVSLYLQFYRDSKIDKIQR